MVQFHKRLKKIYLYTIMPIYQDIPKNKAKRRIIKSLDAKYKKNTLLATTIPVETKIEDLMKSCESIETECEVVLSEFSVVRSEYGYNKQTIQTLYRKIRTGLQDIRGVQWTKISREDAIKLEEYYNSLSQYVEKFNKRWSIVDERIKTITDVTDKYSKRDNQVKEATRKNEVDQKESKQELKQYQDAYKDLEAYIERAVILYAESDAIRSALEAEIEAQRRNTRRRINISLDTLEALASEEVRLDEIAEDIGQRKRELEEIKKEIAFYKDKIRQLTEQRSNLQKMRKDLIKDEEDYQLGVELASEKSEDKITRKALVDGLTDFVNKLGDGVLMNKSGSTYYGDMSGIYIGAGKVHRYLLGGGVFGVVEPQPKRYT